MTMLFENVVTILFVIDIAFEEKKSVESRRLKLLCF